MLFRIFHEQTGPSSVNEPRENVFWISRPLKEYERFPHIALPKPQPITSPFSDLLSRRASRRDFDQKRELTLQSLSDALFSGMGLNETDPLRRHHPSGGALYPLECYIAAYRIESLPSSVYHYEPARHTLADLSAIAHISDISRALIRGTVPEGDDPAAVLFITSMWGRSYPKYGEFAYRIALIEAGHMAQNMVLAATAHAVKCCPAGGFYAEKVAQALDITHDNEDPIYSLFMGM